MPELRFAGMLDMTLGCLKWAAVGFVVAFPLMKLFEASQIHDDIPKPVFKIRRSLPDAARRAAGAVLLSPPECRAGACFLSDSDFVKESGVS